MQRPVGKSVLPRHLQLVSESITAIPDFYCNGIRAGFIDDLHTVRCSCNYQLLTLPQNGVPQLVPRLWHVGADPQFAAQHPQTAESVHHALPQPAVGRCVNARVGGVRVGVVQVDEAGRS